jgi:peptidase M50B-like protein
LLAAVVLRQIPFISIPFNWLESYFHEISHGIAALISGGSIIQIQLFTNGAGLCTTQGGSRFLVSFAGYAGAIIWGVMIYTIAMSHQRVAQIFTGFILLLIATSIALWVRDLLTLFICLVLFALFVYALKTNSFKKIQFSLQLAGMMVLLNSLYSPFYLLDGRSVGDGASLANLTLLPEFVWVLIWSAMGIATLYILARKS